MELWVSSDWGLGLAGEVALGRMGGRDQWGTYSARGFSLLASASYN